MSFDTVQGAVKQLGVTAWLLIGGFVAALISVFLNWFTATADVFGTDISASAGAPPSSVKFMILVPLIAAAWLAWPLFAGTTMSVRRLAGLAAMVVLLFGLIIVIWIVNASEGGNGVTVSPGFGLVLCAAGVIAMGAGVVMLWTNRSKTQGQV